MTASPIKNYVFTSHARFEMRRRGLTEEVIRRVLEVPGQRSEVRPGRHMLQSKIAMGEPAKVYVVRVIVDTDRTGRPPRW